MKMITKEIVQKVIEALEDLGKVNFDWMGQDTFDSMIAEVEAKINEKE